VLRRKNDHNINIELNDFVLYDSLRLLLAPLFFTDLDVHLKSSRMLSRRSNQGLEIDLNKYVRVENGHLTWTRDVTKFQSLAETSGRWLKNSYILVANTVDNLGRPVVSELDLRPFIVVKDFGEVKAVEEVTIATPDIEATGKLIEETAKKFPGGKWEVSATSQNDMHIFYFNANAGPDDNLLFVTYSASVKASILHFANQTNKPMESVSFDVLSAKVGVKAGSYIGADASALLITGSASAFSFSLGLGVSTGIGIKDDSFSFKVAGVGFTIGRKVGISVFDNEIAIDFGKCNIL